MDKNKILKSMQKAIKKVKEKNAIEDVLDSDRFAEMGADEIPAASSGVMEKKKKDCNCKGESEEKCECEEAAPMDKAEQVVKSIMNNFKKISDAYLAKKEGRCWEGYEPTPGKKAYSEGSCQKKSEDSSEDNADIGNAGKDPKKMTNAQNATFGSSIKTGKPGSKKGHKGDPSPGQTEGEKQATIRRQQIKAQLAAEKAKL